jgi:hypothetical protein
MASMPERKISMLKAPANSDSEMMAHCRLETSGVEPPEPSAMRGSR